MIYLLDCDEDEGVINELSIHGAGPELFGRVNDGLHEFSDLFVKRFISGTKRGTTDCALLLFSAVIGIDVDGIVVILLPTLALSANKSAIFCGGGKKISRISK